jgi:uncharacterized protein
LVPAVLALGRTSANNAGVQPVLTIVGSSARAAAFSAARSGFIVHAGDLFADADLQQVAQTLQISDYPSGLGRVISGSQAGGWIYTGALENQPELVDAWARCRPLWGNAGPALRGVRNPRQLAATFARHELLYPATSHQPHDVPRDGSWLRKPLHSAGGAGIYPWVGSTNDPRGGYFQQLVDGTSYAGVYVANGKRAVLLGATEQLVGCAWAGGSGFRYCGSLGPAALADRVLNDFRRIGQALAADFGLRGLFGVDAIVNAHGVWPVEVNPRYTASLEVLERALGLPAIALHVEACSSDRLPDEPTSREHGETCGKAIVFAECRLSVENDWREQAGPTRSKAWPLVADTPEPGSIIEAGWPIATVLASGRDTEQVRRLLRERAAQLRSACREI